MRKYQKTQNLIIVILAVSIVIFEKLILRFSKVNFAGLLNSIGFESQLKINLATGRSMKVSCMIH